jgi:hypothetical protein
MKAFAFSALLFLGTVAGFGQTVPPQFLGVHTNHIAAWPVAVPANLFRTLNSTDGPNKGGSLWFQMQTDVDTYNFGEIDDAMQATAAQGVAVTYTPQGVPSFVVGHDTNGPVGWSLDGTKRRSCACANSYTPDHCFPPGDINADGSGTDAGWITFITALATHVHASHVANPTGYSDISYWENGNEWTYNGQQFCGSFAQMARMLTDEKCIVTGTGPGCTLPPINASAQVMTIALNGGGDPLDKEYVATIPNIPMGETPAQLADIFNYHCYASFPNAESAINLGASTLKFVSNNPDLKGKPVFCTEGGWIVGAHGNPPDTWQHAADFTARFLLGLASSGVQRFIIFGYDFYSSIDGPGNLEQLSDISTAHGCTVSSSHGFLCETGVVWTQIASWLQGITFAGPCTGTPSGTGRIWTCSHTTAGNGYQSGQFAWFDVLDNTALYQVPDTFTRQEDMSGTITAVVSGSSIPLSNSPVLLMDDSLPVAPTGLSSVVH